MTKNGLIQRDDLMCGACRLVRSDLIHGRCRNCAEKAKSQAAHAQIDFWCWFWLLVLIVVIVSEPLHDFLNYETD